MLSMSITRVSIIKKITKYLFISVLVYFLVVLVWIFGIGFLEFDAPFNTWYTSGFSYKKFNTISIGMPKQQVIQLLGESFSIMWSYPGGCSFYSQPNPKSLLIYLLGDVNWYQVSVCFDQEDKVIHKGRSTFFN